MENQTPEVITPQRSKSSPMLWVAIGVAILAAGVGIGLVAGKYFQPVSSTTSVSTIPSTPILSPTVVPVEEDDPTANWKTYSDSGFSFKYPSEMTIENSSALDVSYLKTSDYQPSGEAGYQIQITKVINNISTIGQYMQIEPNTPEQTFLDKQNIVTINGGQVVARTYQGGWSIYKNYYIYSPKLAVILHGTGKDHTTFDQILSTFKFTDQADMSNWKLFQIDGTPFSLKYSPEITLSGAGDWNIFNFNAQELRYNYIGNKGNQTLENFIDTYQEFMRGPNKIAFGSRKPITMGDLSGYKVKGKDLDNTYYFLQHSKAKGFMVFMHMKVEPSAEIIFEKIINTASYTP